MASCKDCFNYELCMDFTTLKESEYTQNYNRQEILCDHFKSKEQIIDLSNADISALFMYAKRALGAGIRETQFNVRCSPNDKVLSAKYVKLKRLYNLAKELRQKSIYYSKKEG